MLEQEIKEQLKSVFSALEKKISLEILSPQELNSELAPFLQDVALTSEKLEVTYSPQSTVRVPTFQLRRAGQRLGIQFAGIPGGHEFTSLIVAILNADGKGKMPEGSLKSRIARLKGPVRLTTFISLTCENCPDVVQALNQMALIHPDFEHTMLDGSFVPEEIERLHIQGVPSVMVGDTLLHSGRIQFLDLLAKLEKQFGVTDAPAESQAQDLGHFDVAVVGGGPAGISAAIYSARKGLKTVVLAERVGGQVQETKGIENLISVPYTEGPELAGALQKHASQYPIQFLEHRRVSGLSLDPASKHKTLNLEGGETLHSSAVIIATGAKWRELGIPGEKEYIGRGVAFCPHCDGPYYKGKKVAVIGGGNSGVEAAIDLAGIVREVVLFEFQPELKADQVLVNKLKSLSNVSIITNAKTQKILGDGSKVVALEYLDRKTEKEIKVELDGVFVQIGLLPNSGFAKGALELTSFGEIVIDGKGRTSMPGVYAAGDVTTVPFKQIIIAMGEGAKAALAAFEDRMKAV